MKWPWIVFDCIEYHRHAYVQVYKGSGHVESWMYSWRDAIRQAIVSRVIDTEPAGTRRVCSGTTDTARSWNVCYRLCCL